MIDNKLHNENEGSNPSIRTLESDLANVIRDDNYGQNIVKIITDPKKNSLVLDDSSFNNVKKKSGFFSSKNIFIFFILMVVMSSLFVIAYVLYRAENVVLEDNILPEPISTEDVSTSTKMVVTSTDLLYPEIIQYANFSNLDKNQIIGEIRKIKEILTDKNIKPGNIVGINTNLNMVQFFEKIRYSGDEALLRSLSDIYVFGVYTNEKNQYEEYLLIKVENFDLAFKSILNWEKYLPTDLMNIFKGSNKIPVEIDLKEAASTSTSTSTSTPTPITNSYYKNNTKGFIDRVLRNYDIREYIKNEDDIHIIYGFLNNKFLLITSGESSFIDIKNRLLKENIIR